MIEIIVYYDSEKYSNNFDSYISDVLGKRDSGAGTCFIDGLRDLSFSYGSVRGALGGVDKIFKNKAIYNKIRKIELIISKKDMD